MKHIIIPDYIEQRENHVLLIWREIPYWMIVDKEVECIIRFWNEFKSSDKIVEKLSYISLEDKKKKIAEIDSLVEFLGKKGIINDGDISYSLSTLNPILKNFTINVTRRCNLRCRHCF